MIAAVQEYLAALEEGIRPVAAQLVGDVQRRASFGYSESGGDLRGFLRLDVGKGAFDFSLVGGTGHGFNFPAGHRIEWKRAELPPLLEAGLEIDFKTEAEVVQPVLLAAETRHIDPNYRAYEFAGCSHVRNVDAVAFGLPDAQKANPADWYGFVRALFAAGKAWCDGVEPPPSIWLGAPRNQQIARDAKENALVGYVGGQPVNTTGYRLPEVAVGENRYIAVDSSYGFGSFLGFVRAICGGFVDLTGAFTNHDAYVQQVTDHAETLRQQRYLLAADAEQIIRKAAESNIGS